MKELIGFLVIVIIIMSTFTYSAYKTRELLTISNKEFRFGWFISGIIMSSPFLVMAFFIYFNSKLEYISQFIINKINIDYELISPLGIILVVIVFVLISKFIVRPIDSYNCLTINKYNRSMKSSVIDHPCETISEAFTMPPWGRRIPSAYEYKRYINNNSINSSTTSQFITIGLSYLFILIHIILVIVLGNKGIHINIVDINSIISLIIVFIIPIIPYLGTLFILNKLIFFIIRVFEFIVGRLINREFKLSEIVSFFMFNYLYMLIIFLIFYIPIKVFQ